MVRKILLLLFFIGVVTLTLYSAVKSATIKDNTLMVHILALYRETGALNAVTATYLDFRVFDTLFETFLLLVSVMGLSRFLRLETTEQIHMEIEKTDTFLFSPIARDALHFILPLLVIFGITIAAFGYESPGGGFQGGTILATIAMVSYLTDKKMRGSYDLFSSGEKWLYISFLVITGGYFLWYAHTGIFTRTLYMILCNFIICFKVDLGLIIIFLRLVGQREHRTVETSYD